MFALILMSGTKIGYQWACAGSIIFPFYYYLAATLLIDVNTFVYLVLTFGVIG